MPKGTFRDRINLKKVAIYAIVINSMQIAAVLLLTVYLFRSRAIHSLWGDMVLALVSLVVIWGAVVDIRDAALSRRVDEESAMLEEALGQLEALNLTLRKQRHDFMNHLQVVFGLIELNQKEEARQYIERIYGDIRKVGQSMKTSLPALNALLAAKQAQCEEKGVRSEFAISSGWEGMPIPPWEMCRVIGNLLDNAIDAVESTPEAAVRLCISETLSAYVFEVEDNGPGMPESILERVFQAGFTTKRAGHGMGLAIVKEILSENGGSVRVESHPGRTVFYCTIPKAAAQ